MTDVVATTKPRALELHQQVIRCGCSDEEKLAPDWHGKRGVPCPKPKAIEDRGIVAGWWRNPLRRTWWRLSQMVRGRRAGHITFTR